MGSKATGPTCQNYVGIVSAKRESEIRSIESIVEKLNLTKGLDKNSIANAMGVDKSNIPNSENLSTKLTKLIEKDTMEFQKVHPLVSKESELMTSPEMNTFMSCKLKSSTSDGNNFLKNNSKNIGALLQTICSTVYTKPKSKIDHYNRRRYENCKRSSATKNLRMTMSDLLKFEKKYNIYGTDRAKGSLTMQLFKNATPGKLQYKSTKIFKLLKDTVSSCIKKYSNSTDKRLSKIKETVRFFQSNYKKTDASCSENSISCHLKKAKQREVEIKKYLAMARGYEFLKCEARVNQPKDLKACQDFKI